MPKRTDIQSILIIGAGPIIIGQACEFDYSGVQACKALRVIRAATDLSGDVDQAIFWYRNEPLQPFAYKTAEQLVSDGRSDDLIRYLMSLEAGAAG